MASTASSRAIGGGTRTMRPPSVQVPDSTSTDASITNDINVSSLSPIFPCQSSAKKIPVNHKVTDFYNVYALPLLIGGTKGIYDESALAFDAYLNLSPLGATYYCNFQLLMLLLEQDQVGTPDLKDNALRQESKLSDILKNPLSYRNLQIRGSLYVNRWVAELYKARVDHVPLPDAAAATVESQPQRRSYDPETRVPPDETRMDTDRPEVPPELQHSMFNQFMRGTIGTNEFTSQVYGGGFDTTTTTTTGGDGSSGQSMSALGNAALDTRPKFDVVLVPIFDPPLATSGTPRTLLGFLLLAFCYDPNFSMLHAYHSVIAELQKMKLGRKSSLSCSIDPIVFEKITPETSETFYKDIFEAMTLVDPAISNSIRTSGSIVLSADSCHNFEALWNFDLAMKHFIAHGREVIGPTFDESTFQNTFGQLKQRGGSCYYFGPTLEAYAFPYSSFHWQRKHYDSMGIEMSHTGILYEWFPWTAREKSDMVHYFSSNSVRGSLNTLPAVFSHVSRQCRETTSGNGVISIPRSSINAIIALHDRMAPEMNSLMIQRHRLATNLEKYIFNHKPEAFQNPAFMQAYKKAEYEFNRHCDNTTKMEKLAIRFAENRLFTLAIDKPLTDSVKALVTFIRGVELQNSDTQANRLLIPPTSFFGASDVGIDFYKIHNDLDPYAHNILYLWVTLRFLHNIGDVRDSLIFRVVGEAAMFPTVGLNINVAATGPKASSKSRLAEEIKKRMVPGTFSGVTSQSDQANAQDADASDLFMHYDETPKWYAGGEAGKGGYAAEASEAKAQLSQGFNVRLICEIHKLLNGTTRRLTRSVVTHLYRSILITSNLASMDDAMLSRFLQLIKHLAIEGNYPGIKLILMPEVYEGEDEEKLAPVHLEHLITANFNFLQHMSKDFDLMNQRRFHAITCLVSKLIQIGALPYPSSDLDVVALQIYKTAKTINGANVRALSRALQIQKIAAVDGAVAAIFNSPGIKEAYGHKGFALEVLHAIKPYLWVTTQQVISCFAMILTEFMEPMKMVVIQYILHMCMTRNWEIIRLLMQVRHNASLKKQSIRTISLSELTNALPSPTPDTLPPQLQEEEMDLETATRPQTVHSSPSSGTPTPPDSPATLLKQFSIPFYLEDAFEKNKMLPLEVMFHYFKEISWRQDSHTRADTGAGAAAPAGTPSHRDVSVPPPVPVESNVSAPMVGRAYLSQLLMEGIHNEETCMIDLNYIRIPNIGNMQELVTALCATVRPGLSTTTIQLYVNNLITQSLPVDAVEVCSLARLRNMKITERLPRTRQDLVLLVHNIAQKQVYICVHLFDHVVNATLNNLLYTAIHSLVYQGMKPHTFLVSNDVRNTMPHFRTLVITQEEINNAPNAVLHVTNPSYLSNVTQQIAIKALEVIHKHLDAKGEELLLAMERKKTTRRVDTEILQVDPDTLLRASVAETNRFEDDALAGTLKPPTDKDHRHDKPTIDIAMDLDEWACLQHFLRVGIPIARDHETNTFKWLKNGKMHPLPTPLNLIQQHSPPPLTTKRTGSKKQTGPAQKRSRMDLA